MKVVGCFLQYEDRFLVLHRHPEKPDGDTWGLPGGKKEPGESDEDAVCRETGEETGYYPSVDELEHLGDYDFVSSRGEPFVYGAYRVRLLRPHDVALEDGAHTEARWVTGEECYAMGSLILGFEELLEYTGYAEAGVSR